MINKYLYDIRHDIPLHLKIFLQNSSYSLNQGM